MNTTTKTEKPILFSTEMVQAILDGRKTQTRRVLKPQERFPEKAFGIFTDFETHLIETLDRQYDIKCPYGKPGDELWVRETFTPFVDITGAHGIAYEDGVSMRFSDNRVAVEWIHKRDQRRYPSIHMPRWASRIQLQIWMIRVERVQSITNKDAMAEGCEAYHWNPAGADLDNVGGVGYKTWVKERDAFSYLWDEINADRGYPWEDNPWVWVVEFSVKDIKE